MGTLRVLCALAVTAYARSVQSGSSICDFDCGDSDVNFPIGDRYIVTQDSWLKLENGRRDDKSTDMDLLYDSQCSFILSKSNYRIKFLTNSDGKINTACVMQDSIDIEKENLLKSVASMILLSHDASANDDFVTDISGQCQVSYDLEESRKVRTKKFSDCVLPFENGDKAVALDGFVQTCTYDFNKPDSIECIDKLNSEYPEAHTRVSLKSSNYIEVDTTTQGQGRLTSLQLTINDGIQSTNVREALENACAVGESFSSQPSRFVNLVSAVRNAQFSELYSVNQVLDGVCQNGEGLNGRTLFYDAIKACRSESCVELGTTLIMNGEVSLNDANSWLVSFASGVFEATDGSARVVELIGNVIQKFYDNENFYNANVLALGAVIGNLCKDNKKCSEYGVVQQAVNTMQRPLKEYLSTSYSSDRDIKQRLLASLKAFANAGVGPTNRETIKKLLSAGDSEISAAAVRSLGKLSCNEERFEALATLLSEPSLDLLESYQFAYVELWKCPSVEAQQLSEWIYANTEWEVVRSLVYTHAVAISSSTSDRYFEAKSLLQGITSEGTFAQLFQLQNSYFAIASAPYIGQISGLKIMQPGSWIPRSIDISADITNFQSAVGLRLRTENVENSILNAIFEENENFLTNDPAEQAVTMKLGKTVIPHITVDVQLGGNELYTFNNNHVDEIVQHVKKQVDEVLSMSAYEKVKAALGYSNAGFLKYLNGEPVDFQREISLSDQHFVIVASNGQKIDVKSDIVALSNVRGLGSLSAFGFNGRFEPQFTVQRIATLEVGKTTITYRDEATANLNSALSVSYTQSSGVLDVQVEKNSQKAHELVTFGRTILLNGVDTETGDGYYDEDLYYSPTLDVQLILRDGPMKTALLYTHQHDHPLTIRTQYDTSNGLLLSASIKPSREDKTEFYTNYRESDSHLVALLSMDSSEMKIEGKISPKKFTGQIVNKNFFPMYDLIELVVEDRATDAESQQNVFKPSIKLVTDGETFVIKDDIQLLTDRINQEIDIDAGPLGRYFVTQQLGKQAPQVLLEVHLGQKPDPDFPSPPFCSGIVSMKQLQTPTHAGFNFEAHGAMGNEKYGLEAKMIVAPNGAKVYFGTDGLLDYLLGTEEMVFDGAAKWAANRSKSQYKFLVSELVIPGVLETTKKLNLKVERVSEKGQPAETDVNLDISGLKIMEEKTTIKLQGHSSINSDYSAASFNIEIEDAILPQLPYFTLNGFKLTTDYSLSANQADAHFNAGLSGLELMAASAEYKKKNALRQIAMKLTSPMNNIDYGFDAEIEIKNQFDLRVFVNPSMDGSSYPALIKYADESKNGKLNLALQISATGVMSPGVLGQADTMTLTLGLLEEPKFVYTINGKMLGEDLLRENAAETFYSSTLTIANGETKRGFSFSASNESNEMLAAECMFDETENDTELIVRGRVSDSHASLMHQSHKQNGPNQWFNKGKTTIVDGVGLWDPNTETTMLFTHDVKSNDVSFHGEFDYSPAPDQNYHMNAIVNINYRKQTCDARLQQNLMAGQGFDVIALKAQYVPKGQMLKYMIGRNGKAGRAKGQLRLLENGMKNSFQLSDEMLENFIPSQAQTELKWSTENEIGFDLKHKHNGNKVDLVVVSTHFKAAAKQLTFNNSMKKSDQSTKQVLDIRLGTFNSMDTPAVFQFTNQDSAGRDDEFVAQISTDSQRNFLLKQLLKIDGVGEEVSLEYKNDQNNYSFSIDIKQSFSLEFYERMKLSQEIQGKGASGLEATSLLEMWSNGQSEDCKLVIEASPNQDNANFKVTWTTSLSFIRQYMKMLEHLVAQGSASWRLPNPSAQFSLTAVSTNESADIEFSSSLHSLANFQMKLAAEQYFNVLPFYNNYAIELINDYFISSDTKTSSQMIITMDDPYTPEVETYITEFVTIFGVPTKNYPSFLQFMDNIPPKATSTLTVPEFVFGETPFNSVEVGYSLDIDAKIGALTFAIDDKSASFSLEVSETGRGGYNIAVDYSHANFAGVDGTFTLNQSIDLLDNGFRVSEYGFSIPIFAITNKLVLQCPGRNIDLKPRVDFKMENTDRLFSIDLKWKQDTNAVVKEFTISFKSSDSTADLNVALYEKLMNESNLPSIAIGLFSIAKTAADPFGIGIVHGVVQNALSGQQARRSRQRFGGEFDLALRNYFADDVAVSVSNVYESKEENFKFTSVIGVICEECGAPKTDHDLEINYNGKVGGVQFRWNLDIDNTIVIDSQFRVQAGITSFRIRGDPLFELTLAEPINYIEKVKIELEFDAKNSEEQFSMTMNRIGVSVNNDQYTFGLSKGLLRIIYGSRFQLVSSMSHNIDALSEIMILERSEFNTDFKVIDPATSSFEATLTLRGASRRSNELQMLHDISAQGQLQVAANQDWVRTGVVMIKANSPILPSEMKITVNRIGLEEIALFTFQGVADFVIVSDGENISVFLEQKLAGNYRTKLSLDYKNDIIINIVNDWLTNSIQSEFDVAFGTENYSSKLDCSWGESSGTYTFDGLYTHNILEITRLTSIPSKAVMNGRLSGDFTVFQFTTEIGSYGATEFSYDVDFSDSMGHIMIDIPDVTRQSLKFMPSLQSPGYSLVSSTSNYSLQASSIMKCQREISLERSNSCKLKVQNIYKSGRTVKKINMNGLVDFAAENGDFKCDSKLGFDILGNKAKLSNSLNYRQNTGVTFDLTWNMDSLPVAKFIQVGAKTAFANRGGSRRGQVKLNFDEMEPISVQYSDVFTQDTATVGMRASIGALIGGLEELLDLDLGGYGLPRNWFEWEVNIDRLASKYGIRLAPDHLEYRGDISFNREGVNLIFSQPHHLRFVPTTFSGHCDYIQSDNQVSCNIKTTIDNIQRELHFSGIKTSDMFEFEAKLKPEPMALPITSMLRVTQHLPAVTVFAHVSCDSFDFNSNNQFNAKRNRYTFQTTNQLNRDGTTDNYNLGIEFNSQSKVVVITSLFPGMGQEEQLEIPLKEASKALRMLFQDTGVSQNIGRLVPRIGREKTESELLFYIGFGRSSNEYADVTVRIFKGFEAATDESKASVYCGMAVGFRNVQSSGISKKLDLATVNLSIKDQSYVQGKFSVDESLIRFTDFDFNQLADDLHAGIDEYSQIFKLFLENILKTVKVSGVPENESVFAYYIRVARELGHDNIGQMTASLHQMTNYLMFELRSINPDAATTQATYTTRDIVSGLLTNNFDISLDFSELVSEFEQDMLGDVVPDLPEELEFFISNEAWRQMRLSVVRGIVAEVSSVNDHMLIITLPIPLSAQDPENFNIKKAIIESPVVQGFYKVMSLEETMNLWFKIRAALAKPSSPLLPPHAAIATVSNGKHFTTFDGRTFSLSVSGRLDIVHLMYFAFVDPQIETNCEILLAKDFGRTGSSISLVNGRLSSKLTAQSGFEVSEENGVIVIRAAGRLFGNVAGALGTMSGETADDFISPAESNDTISAIRNFNPRCNVSAVDHCGSVGQVWKKNLKALYPCLPVVDAKPYYHFVKAETCQNNKADECAIMRQYQFACQQEGAFIQTAC